MTQPSDPAVQVHVADSFELDIHAGGVIGSRSATGCLRGGIDVGGVFSADNGAMRIAPLIEPGWGRASLAYGPFPRSAGLTLGVFILNGHNTAQVERITDPLLTRLDRWLRGSEAESRSRRLLKWLTSGRVTRTLREFRWWVNLRASRANLAPLDENLAIGWFEKDAPTDPARSGSGFVMHAAGPVNGELWATVNGQALPVARGVHNIPHCYVIVLRERGAAYYAASWPRSEHFPAPPQLRPLAIDSDAREPDVCAVISQSTIGQIGFRIDSRLYGVRVASVSRLARWYGTAHAADSGVGDSTCTAVAAEIGGAWQVRSGSIRRSAAGFVADQAQSLAVLWPDERTGLIHCELQPGSGGAALLWRRNGDGDYLAALMGPHGCTLLACLGGTQTQLAVSDALELAPDRFHSVQLTDDGAHIRIAVNGKAALAHVVGHCASDALGVGMYFPEANAGTMLRVFEAHPATVPMPEGLVIEPGPLRFGGDIVVRDDFGLATGVLENGRTSVGDRIWQRTLGRGVIEVPGDGSARVQASVERPNPGRTLFTLGWTSPDFADLEVEMTVPGTARGQKHQPRGGLVIWQDADNYVIWNLWRNDSYGGSLSTFFQIDGFEDLYDAVWCNIGARADFGARIRLRVVVEGDRFLALIDGEPILYRRISDVYPHCRGLRIERVGLAVNWEWGNDTGTVFRDFVARGR